MTVARRVAAERGEALGGSVGYAVRFDAVWPQRPGGICYMTSGLLLKRLHQNGLCGVSHVIVDEVHERDLDNDVLLGLLRSALATIDARKFQEFFQERSMHSSGPCPVIAVQGHSFQVKALFLEDIVEKMQWTPPEKLGCPVSLVLLSLRVRSSPVGSESDSERDNGAVSVCRFRSMSQKRSPCARFRKKEGLLLCVVSHLSQSEDLLETLVSEGTVSPETGSVLVFLPTWHMMSILRKLLEADATLSKCKVIMLHSQVPKEAQMEAFQPAPGMAKVILATNIAESSITIDDVTCVIDACKVKLTSFSETTRLSYTDVVFTGRQNLEQRKGRAGRTRPGLCFRLITRKRFEEGLEDRVPPELTRMPLVGAALLVKSLELGDIAAVLSQCPDPPSERSVAHAIAELKLVRALDEHESLTALGRILARLPLDPHVGVALLMGHWLFGLGDAMATICAAMSFDEPFQFEKTAGYMSYAAQEKYKGCLAVRTDLAALACGRGPGALSLKEYARLMSTGGEAAAKGFCQREGLHPAIMRQAYHASEQLRALLQSDALGGMAVGSLEDEDTNGTNRGGRAVQQIRQDTVGTVHRGSINCCNNSYVFPSPIFAFLDQVKEGGGGGGYTPTRCRQLTNMAPLLALLKPFANGEIRMDDQDRNGGSLSFSLQDTVQLILMLRKRLEDVMCEFAEQLAETRGFAPKDPELQGLLQDEGIDMEGWEHLSRCKKNSRAGPPARPVPPLPRAAAPAASAAPRGAGGSSASGPGACAGVKGRAYARCQWLRRVQRDHPRCDFRSSSGSAVQRQEPRKRHRLVELAKLPTRSSTRPAQPLRCEVGSNGNTAGGTQKRKRQTSPGAESKVESPTGMTEVVLHAENLPVRISHGSACLPAVGGRKDTMAVMLPELHRTCHLLKQPLLFLDRPAALFLLVDGLRESSAAALFCAQRFHTFFLPRLSARHDEPEDFELIDMVNQAVEDLDKSLLESNARYAGCGLALLLVLGQRVLVANVGHCRAVLCTPPKRSAGPPSSKDLWNIRLLVGGGRTGKALADVTKLERLRRMKEYAPLDFEGKVGDVLSGSSVGASKMGWNVVGLFGNSLEEFQSSGRKLEEIEVLVLSVFSGGRAEVISELWPHVKVKWIHCLSAGVDTLVPVLKTLPGALETPLTNAKGAFSRSLAEYSVAAMMYFNKQIPRLQANRASRTWEKFQMQERSSTARPAASSALATSRRPPRSCVGRWG
eukprot:g13424.t1